MFDETDIKAAETAGILTSDQAGRLRAFLAKRATMSSAVLDPASPAPPERAADGSESLRFLTNFNDIFITIGIAILFMGLLAVFGVMFGGSIAGMAMKGSLNWSVLMVMGPVAATMWFLAEYFTGKRPPPIGCGVGSIPHS